MRQKQDLHPVQTARQSYKVALKHCASKKKQLGGTKGFVIQLLICPGVSCPTPPHRVGLCVRVCSGGTAPDRLGALTGSRDPKIPKLAPVPRHPAGTGTREPQKEAWGGFSGSWRLAARAQRCPQPHGGDLRGGGGDPHLMGGSGSGGEGEEEKRQRRRGAEERSGREASRGVEEELRRDGQGLGGAGSWRPPERAAAGAGAGAAFSRRAAAARGAGGSARRPRAAAAPGPYGAAAGPGSCSPPSEGASGAQRRLAGMRNLPILLLLLLCWSLGPVSHPAAGGQRSPLAPHLQPRLPRSCPGAARGGSLAASPRPPEGGSEAAVAGARDLGWANSPGGRYATCPAVTAERRASPTSQQGFGAPQPRRHPGRWRCRGDPAPPAAPQGPGRLRPGRAGLRGAGGGGWGLFPVVGACSWLLGLVPGGCGLFTGFFCYFGCPWKLFHWEFPQTPQSIAVVRSGGSLAIVIRARIIPLW